jgi:ABC-type nitrate/sulfonate/bicarbonate transport system permease component
LSTSRAEAAQPGRRTAGKRDKPDVFYPAVTLLVAIGIWEAVVRVFHVPGYVLPAPSRIATAFVSDFPLIMTHAKATFIEAGAGIAISVALAITVAVAMDNFILFRKSFYPILIVSQTIPVMAIAPILLIWFGFGYLPKIVIIVLMCFFPIAISLIEGFSNVDKDYLDLFRVLKASKLRTYRDLKFPNALPYFFSGLKISVTYMLMAAIIGEWLGGNSGIGVYMLRSKQAFALDKVFAAVVFVVLLSVALIAVVNAAERRTVHWKAESS